MLASREFVKKNGGISSILPTTPQSESGSTSSTTHSAISDGTINITDPSAQMDKTGQTVTEVLENLNRDVENAHGGPLTQDPNVIEMTVIQGKFVALANKTAGGIGQAINKKSEEMYKDTKNEKWNTGGVYPTLLNAAAAVLATELGHGSTFETTMGALGGYLVTGQTNQFAKEMSQIMSKEPGMQSMWKNTINSMLNQ